MKNYKLNKKTFKAIYSEAIYNNLLELQNNKIHYCFSIIVFNNIKNYIFKDSGKTKNICHVKKNKNNKIRFIDTKGNSWKFGDILYMEPVEVSCDTIKSSKLIYNMLLHDPELEILASVMCENVVELSTDYTKAIETIVGIKVVNNIGYFTDSNGRLWPYAREIKL